MVNICLSIHINLNKFSYIMIDWRIYKNYECFLPHPVVACLSFFWKICWKESMYIMFKGELKIVSLANVNKYLHNGKNKVRVDVNNSREKLKKKSSNVWASEAQF